MRRVRVIPVLTIDNNKLVKTVKFKKPNYIGDPVNAVKIFNDKEVDEIVLLDITATKEGREPSYSKIEEICSEAFMPFAYGGGITNMDQINRLFQLGIEKIIFTSTVAVYGLDAGVSTETDKPNPFNDYGKSKLQAEEVFRDWLNEDIEKRSLTTMRLVATFGAGNRGNVYNLISQVAKNRFVMIGNGVNHKSLAYVENVVGFLVHCMEFGVGENLYNYADKPDMNMKDMMGTIRAGFGKNSNGVTLPYAIGLAGGYIFDQIANITGKALPISSVRVKKFCANTVVDSSKRVETGYKASHDLADGLTDMIKVDFADYITANFKSEAE